MTYRICILRTFNTHVLSGWGFLFVGYYAKSWSHCSYWKHGLHDYRGALWWYTPPPSPEAVADVGGGGGKCNPLWWLVMYFCVHNCTNPSNGYAAVACSNNNQAQLHTRISIPYWSPDVWLGLQLLRDIQFRLPAILNYSLMSLASWPTITRQIQDPFFHAYRPQFCASKVFLWKGGATQ